MYDFNNLANSKQNKSKHIMVKILKTKYKESPENSQKKKKAKYLHEN